MEKQKIVKPENVIEIPGEHRCTQCGKLMGGEWFLGPVCGKCCRANHRAVMGRRKAPRNSTHYKRAEA